MTNNRNASVRSEELFELAQTLIPGGVNSPVRAFSAVGGTPRFIERASGAYLWDVDGNRYLDYVMSWGPLIHGHAYPPVVDAVERAARNGTSFGAPSPAEIDLAALVVDAIPSIEMVRFVNSGTEAAMSAIRLARGATGRDVIVKFAGNYHGHADMLLARAGSGSLTLGVPTSPGVPAGAAAGTLVLPYNDIAALEETFKARGPEIAAVIVEPIAGNMGVVPGTPAFLQRIRELTERTGAIFICDEVITGFRVSSGGAQQMYDQHPDITVLGKIIGGGLPVGAYGGRRDLMSMVAPSGPVYQAGTLSGNPLAMAAGIAGLQPLRDDGFYRRLEETTQVLAANLREAARHAGVPVTVNACTGMLTIFFTAEPVTTLADAERCDTGLYARFFHAMLDRGVYLPPSQFEAWMVSARHTPAILEETNSIATDAFQEIAQK
jgi:glutamate-1-semialdehyde 2,1-aminomutase